MLTRRIVTLALCLTGAAIAWYWCAQDWAPSRIFHHVGVPAETRSWAGIAFVSDAAPIWEVRFSRVYPVAVMALGWIAWWVIGRRRRNQVGRRCARCRSEVGEHDVRCTVCRRHLGRARGVRSLARLAALACLFLIMVGVWNTARVGNDVIARVGRLSVQWGSQQAVAHLSFALLRGESDIPGFSWRHILEVNEIAAGAPLRVWTTTEESMLTLQMRFWVWAAVLLCAIFPGVRFLQWIRMRAHARRGLCLACGYDRRDSDRCPECGAQAHATASETVEAEPAS